MQLVKNKTTDKPFIVLDDAGVTRFLLITPEGKVKSLERRLFDPQVAVDLKTRAYEHELTQIQMARYAEFVA